MRDILLLTIILGSTPICFFNPYFGVLMWSWVAYFNPHRYTWGVAYHFPVAWTIALPTVAGALFTRQKNRPFLLRETFLIACLWAWFAITFLYARQVPIFHGHILDAETQLLQVSKILLMTFFTILLVTSRERLKYLLLVASLSLGIRGIAGAIFGFRTGGQSRIYGPADSFLSDNNDFGLALNMMLPLLFFLAREVEQRWLRITLWIAFFCSIISILLTYSRGGLLGLAVVLCAIAVKSRHKFVGATLVAATALVVVSYAPEAWMARMNNFFQGSLDTSAQERLVSWGFAWNLAKAYPITGGAFQTFPDEDVFQRYAKEALPGGYLSTGPHSVYFQVLGEHGFVGLTLYLLLLGFCLLTLRRLRRLARRNPSLDWIANYSHMLEAGLFGFMVSGAFLGRAYFDLYFLLVAATVILKILYIREAALPASVRESDVHAEASETMIPVGVA